MTLHHQLLARQLSFAARELLIEHIDGEVFISIDIVMANGPRMSSIKNLVRIGLLRYYPPYGRPSKTVVTEEGRAVLSHVLANYADALVHAGYGLTVKKATVMTKAMEASLSQIVPTDSQEHPDQPSEGSPDAATSPAASIPSESQQQASASGAG